MTAIGPHIQVHEYDGAYRCMACHELWGAITGNPPMPEKCVPTQRRQIARRTTDRRDDTAQGRTQEQQIENEYAACICIAGICLVLLLAGVYCIAAAIWAVL